MTTLAEALPAFLERVNAYLEDHTRENFAAAYKAGFADKVKHMTGKKYTRIVKYDPRVENSGSAYCFLDESGNIYKPDGWKKPAAGIRGNIFTDPDYSLGKGLGPYGAARLR